VINGERKKDIEDIEVSKIPRRRNLKSEEDESNYMNITFFRKKNELRRMPRKIEYGTGNTHR